MALGIIESRAWRRPSCENEKSSGSASRTNSAATATAAAAATSHRNCTPVTSVAVTGETTQAVIGGLPGDCSARTPVVLALPPAQSVLSDVFHISASSSSSSLADRDDLTTSIVEVSQATQSFRHHDHTHSEVDATSEWADASMDRTYKRRTKSGLGDRNRLHFLSCSEAEVRASLMHMYALQHRRLLLRCGKEQLIDQRVSMLRDYQTERTALCVGWLLARERAARGNIAREWWMERDATVRCTSLHGPHTTNAAAPSSAIDAAAAAAKRDDSVVLVTSHPGLEDEVCTSDETDGGGGKRRHVQPLCSALGLHTSRGLLTVAPSSTPA